MTGNRFFGPSGDGFLNTESFVDILDEIEKFDPEKGMAMAISKHALGNKGNYYNEFIKYAGEYIRKTFDDYGKAIAKGFKDSINKDFNERFAKSGVEK